MPILKMVRIPPWFVSAILFRMSVCPPCTVYSIWRHTLSGKSWSVSCLLCILAFVDALPFLIHLSQFFKIFFGIQMFYVHLRKSHFATFLGSKMGHGGSSETGGELSFNLKHLH